MYRDLDTPATVLNLGQIESNIKNMVEINKKYGIVHRPHIKAHKSGFLARKQIELGAQGITCAKIAEAEIMADEGINDIFIAYPLIGERKWQKYFMLQKRVKLMTIVNSYEGAKGLSDTGTSLKMTATVLIEVDGGMNRGGLKPMEPTLEFANKIKDLPNIKIVGLMYYGGTIYSCTTEDKIITRTKLEHDEIISTANLLKENEFNMELLSTGSSFSSKFPKYLEGVSEVRAGNYIFNDCVQLSIGGVKEEECSLRIVSTVVCKPDDKHIIIDAGSKSLTSDICSNRPGYGYIVGYPEYIIEKLNEEHGFVCSDNNIELNVGDLIEIIPNHACVIPNLNEFVYGYRDGKFKRKLRVDARGKSC